MGIWELLILGVVLVVLYFILRRPWGRLMVGSLCLIGGLLLVTLGFFTLREIDEHRAALGPARIVANALPAVEQSTRNAQAEMFGGVFLAGSGICLLFSYRGAARRRTETPAL